MKNKINEAWKDRHQIAPEYDVAKKPETMQVVKLLPKTNCKECGQSTCLVFSTLVIQGAKGADDCPPLAGENKQLLTNYLGQFDSTDC